MSAVKGDLGMRVDPKLLGDEEERISKEEAAADGVAVSQSLQLEGWTIELARQDFFPDKENGSTQLTASSQRRTL